ncbi:hypothetical protein [Ethanoligenens sp.]|uniref:DUF7336 domain-containing protein n=1 Tax=Ethanoligenens sp. TaxID=2099655 RepID=UPI0039E96E9A
MIVYQLMHKVIIESNENVYSGSLIGFYSSRKKAEETIKKYKSIEGFKDYPNGFIIEEYEVDDDNVTFD